MKPGETITPGGNQAKPNTPQVGPHQAATTSKPPSAAQSTKKAEKPAPTENKTPATWQYKAEDAKAEANEPAETASPYIQPISWTASEYISHQKGFGWFVLVLLAVAGLAGVVYLITDDLISPIVILIIGVAFTVFAGRPPQTLEYSIDGTGVHIGSKSYPYDRFRSFAVLADEPIPTIMLTPIRRFDLPINIHFDPADAEKIIEILGNYLPGEEREAPAVDRFMSKIRF